MPYYVDKFFWKFEGYCLFCVEMVNMYIWRGVSYEDIIKKCNLVLNNILISNSGIGYDDEIDLEIYNEIKEEIIEALENITKSIIQGYKNYKKMVYMKDVGFLKKQSLAKIY